MADIDLRTQDKRTVERAIRIGAVDEKAWEKHLKSLPDVADKCTKVEMVLDVMDEDLEGGDAPAKE